MADVKINERTICGDDSFRVTSGDLEEASQYYGLSHNATDALAQIGVGSKVTNYADPTILADEAYIDLLSDSMGHGFILIGDADGYVRFFWNYDGSVTLVENTSNVTNADTDLYFCIFDNGTNVRIKNRLGNSVRILCSYEYTELYFPPIFEVFKTFSGVDNLDPNLTINGVTETPLYRYKGGDADLTEWAAWGYGGDLPLDYSGDDPTPNVGSPLLGDNDDAVKFNGGKNYYGTDASGPDITTEDFVVEMIVKVPPIGATESIFSKRQAASPNTGIYCYFSNTGRISFSIDAGAAAITSTTAVLEANTWYHYMLFVNRDENSTYGVQSFINGEISGGGQDPSTVTGTLTNTNYLRVGGNQSGGATGNHALAYLAVWKRSSWHQADEAGRGEWDGIAKERFLRVSGAFPSVYAGPVDVISDGDMEEAGTGSWTANSGATLTKETGTPYAGSQCLRVKTTSGDVSSHARQDIFVVDSWYKLSGWYRSDGVGQGVIYIGATSYVFLGTDTSWTYFEYTALADAIYLLLGSYYAPADQDFYVEYDNVKVELLSPFPTVDTRAFSAYLDKVEGDYRKLYYVGPEWMRMSYRHDSNAARVRGYLSEIQAENLFNYSEDFASGWGKIDAGDVVTDDQVVCPDGRVAAASIIADSTDGVHGVQKAVTLTAETYAFSVFARPGDKDWIRIICTTLTNVFCDFDVTNGTVGTSGSNATGYIEGPFYGDFYRCCIVYTSTAASITHHIRPIEADGDTTFAGDGVTVNTYIWGAQVEQSDYMTSPVPTAGAAQTRLVDQLRYDASTFIGSRSTTGTITMDVLFPSYDLTDASKYLVELSDGAADADRIGAYIHPTDDAARAAIRRTSGSDGDVILTGDAVNGAKHSMRLRWSTDDMNYYMDSESGSDTSVGIPDDIDRLDVGRNRAGILHTDGLIAKLRLYGISTLKG